MRLQIDSQNRTASEARHPGRCLAGREQRVEPGCVAVDRDHEPSACSHEVAQRGNVRVGHEIGVDDEHRRARLEPRRGRALHDPCHPMACVLQ